MGVARGHLGTLYCSSCPGLCSQHCTPITMSAAREPYSVTAVIILSALQVRIILSTEWSESDRTPPSSVWAPQQPLLGHISRETKASSLPTPPCFAVTTSPFVPRGAGVFAGLDVRAGQSSAERPLLPPLPPLKSRRGPNCTDQVTATLRFQPSRPSSEPRNGAASYYCNRIIL